MVYTHDWKRKYFVLTGDKLYYYDNDLGDGSGGSGVIHLECFLDCVEAPLTDHKKATNVLILLAKERGLFEQVKLNVTLHLYISPTIETFERTHFSLSPLGLAISTHVVNTFI